MAELKNTRVYRGGQTARNMNFETGEVSLHAPSLIYFKFTMDSKGGGKTEVRVEIEPDDFPALVAAMMKADRECSMQTMAKALYSEIDKQAVLDQEKIQIGRESVVKAAEQALETAPADRNHAERLAKDMVRQLVDSLNSEEDKAAVPVSPVG